MKKIFILIYMVFIILLQFIHDVNTQPDEIPSNMIAASIIGGIVSGLTLIILTILVGLCYFLAKRYKNKKEKSTPDLDNNESRNNISKPGKTNNELYNEPTPTELIISNPNSPNYNNQQVTTHELGNNSINNGTIQNIRQGNLLSFNIDENIIEQMKQDALQDIKQELKQNLRSKVMTSFYRDNNVEDSSNINDDK